MHPDRASETHEQESLSNGIFAHMSGDATAGEGEGGEQKVGGGGMLNGRWSGVDRLLGRTGAIEQENETNGKSQKAW